MEIGKFIGLLVDNKIDYGIDEQADTVKVFTSYRMSQDYVFAYNWKTGDVKLNHTVTKWNGRRRNGTEVGVKFLHNLEFAPHRITGKRKEV